MSPQILHVNQALTVATASFVPTDIAGLVAWYDASDAGSITESSGAVSQWDDLSGNGYHLTQSTGSLQPTTGTRTQNGLNVLDFAGDILTVAVTETSPWTAFVVCYPDAVANLKTVFAQNGGAWEVMFHNGQFGLSGASQMAWYGASPSSGPSYAATTPYVLEVVTNGASSAWTLNGATDTTTSFSGGLTTLGVGGYPASGDLFDGWIGEFILYGSALTSDRATVRDYLNAKWSVY